MKADTIIFQVEEREVDGERHRGKMILMLTCSLGGQDFCLDAGQLREVLKVPPLTRVPPGREYIAGVVNLRGEIITCLDIRGITGGAAGEITDRSRLIIVDTPGGKVGVLADGVEKMIEVEESVVQPPLSTVKGRLAEYVRGEMISGEKIFVWLDLKQVLADISSVPDIASSPNSTAENRRSQNTDIFH